jgi:hypothetical protein
LVPPALPTAAERGTVAEDEVLPTVTVTAQRVANGLPASLYATIATALRYDPEVDLQSRGLAEAQADVTVRGGVFENTAVAVGAVTVHDPQTGHYTSLLPIDAEVLSGPRVRTDTAHALAGFNATLVTLAYTWRPLSEQREITAGMGSDALRFGGMAIADTHTDDKGTVTGIEARYAASAGDGSRPQGDHEFERALLHAQRRSAATQTDLAIAWQDSFFGWPGAYTGFASLPETDHTRTALLTANRRVELANDASDHGDSWLEFGGYYRDLEDDYDFDRRTEESGTPGSFEHRTRSYAAAVQGRHAGPTWAWRYGLQVSADELVRSTDLTHGHFNSRHYLKLSVAPERRWQLPSDRELRLQLGATLDASSRDEEAWLPLASLAYARMSDAGADVLTASFHASSQVPGYTALNSAPDGLFGGNADLGHERTDSLSLRYERQRTKQWLVADLTVGYAYLDKQADYGTASVDASYYALNYARQRLTAAVRYALNDYTTLYFDKRAASTGEQSAARQWQRGLPRLIGARVAAARRRGPRAVADRGQSDQQQFPGVSGDAGAAATGESEVAVCVVIQSG